MTAVSSGQNFTTISSWLGASTAFITAWFDQSGSGNDVTQADVNRQPTMVVLANGTVAYQGASGKELERTSITNFRLAAAQPHTVTTRFDNMTNSDGQVYSIGEPWSSQYISLMPRSPLLSGVIHYIYIGNDAGATVGAESGTVAVQTIDGGLQRKIALGGVDVTNGAGPWSQSLNLPASPVLRVGGDMRRSAGCSVSGRIYDLIIYRQRLSTDTMTCGANKDSSLTAVNLNTACTCANGFSGRTPNCQACGANHGSIMSGSDRVCVCAAGYFGSAGNCTICPIGSYCPFNSAAAIACPTGIKLSSPGGKSVDDCSPPSEWLPVGIFSMRLQLLGYTGPMFRIRRSSDSVEADLFLGLSYCINDQSHRS